MNLESMYQEIILEHYKHPRGKGLREPFDVEVNHVNPSCGDEIDLRVQMDGNVIADVSYDGQGCSISQASVSVMFEQVKGLDVDAAFRALDDFYEMVQSRGKYAGDDELIGDGVAFAGVAQFPARVKCALLGWLAMKDAVSQALEKAK
ncbi:MAG: Iron-sulfur cluster assembly scaffold protein IscU [Actinomycetota bacterium]